MSKYTNLKGGTIELPYSNDLVVWIISVHISGRSLMVAICHSVEELAKHKQKYSGCVLVVEKYWRTQPGISRRPNV